MLNPVLIPPARCNLSLKGGFLCWSRATIGFIALLFCSMNALAQPANDNYANAIDATALINGSSPNAAYTTIGATADKSAGSNWNNSGPTYNVWFKFTASPSGRMNVVVHCGGAKGTMRRSQLALWQTNGTTEIASVRYRFNNEDINVYAASLTPGATYYISVDAYSAGYCGTFTLALQDHRDNDGDGVEDEADIDNDNDGIPDWEEGGGNLIKNGSFEKDDFTNAAAFPNGFTGANGTFIGTSFNTNQVTDWNYDLNLDGWVGGAPSGSSNNAAAYQGGQFMDVIGSSSYTGGVQTKFWQDIPTEPGKEYTLSFHWGEDVGHSAGQIADIIAKAIDASNVELLVYTDTIEAQGPVGGVIGPKHWYYVAENFTATTTTTRILFTCTQPAGNAGAGANLDLVNVRPAQLAGNLDTDGDGVPDYLDLDSDNDGIYDLVEAGHGGVDANMDGTMDGEAASFGTNGLANSVETATDSGVMNYLIRDSDGNGIKDFRELDSDGDDCFDAVEAGFVDPDGDGTPGNAPITVDDHGKVTSLMP